MLEGLASLAILVPPHAPPSCSLHSLGDARYFARQQHIFPVLDGPVLAAPSILRAGSYAYSLAVLREDPRPALSLPRVSQPSCREPPAPPVVEPQSARRELLVPPAVCWLPFRPTVAAVVAELPPNYIAGWIAGFELVCQCCLPTGVHGRSESVVATQPALPDSTCYVLRPYTPDAERPSFT